VLITVNINKAFGKIICSMNPFGLSGAKQCMYTLEHKLYPVAISLAKNCPVSNMEKKLWGWKLSLASTKP
jgi:hypothetical protein